MDNRAIEYYIWKPFKLGDIRLSIHKKNIDL